MSGEDEECNEDNVENDEDEDDDGGDSSDDDHNGANAKPCGDHQSSRSPATRRVNTSVFSFPQWHGATQTHFPPRPRKTAWQSGITNVVSPHGVPQTKKDTTM